MPEATLYNSFSRLSLYVNQLNISAGHYNMTIATAIRAAKISPGMTQDLGKPYLRDSVI